MTVISHLNENIRSKYGPILVRQHDVVGSALPWKHLRTVDYFSEGLKPLVARRLVPAKERRIGAFVSDFTSGSGTCLSGLYFGTSTVIELTRDFVETISIFDLTLVDLCRFSDSLIV